jgi:hypothetical protein
MGKDQGILKGKDQCGQEKISYEGGKFTLYGERSLGTGKDQDQLKRIKVWRKIIGDGERSRSIEKNKGMAKDHWGRGSISPKVKGKDQS